MRGRVAEVEQDTRRLLMLIGAFFAVVAFVVAASALVQLFIDAF